MAENSDMSNSQRKVLGREAMAVAFEHLTTRVLFALERPEVRKIKTLVVSGGVASNAFLKQILRTNLDVEGHKDVELVFPPLRYCTDNAAMIAVFAPFFPLQNLPLF